MYEITFVKILFDPATICVRDQDCDHTTNKVAEGITKLTLLHALLIYQILSIY